MKKSIFISLFTFFIAITSGIAQDETPAPSLNSGTIYSQFEYLNSVSNNYQEYKVVKRTNLDKIRQNVTDSLNVFKDQLVIVKKDLKERQAQIEELENQMAEVQQQLTKAEEARDSFEFLGMPIHKSAYNSIMWTIVVGLSAAFLFFLFQYSQSHKVISKARKDLEETVEEFEQHRKNTLERERKLKRELVDALNKKPV
ncbi:hypothetical protein A33Q_2317 [Indibacter alkaliphilus LW1]|jgi:cell division septum initiation protein DivIVA|uniref:tRNA (Guanine-N1)-methyltransferase n=1 Tax=Indibacter alkaliphilus (strain CCUG 57479 / KCTC 22604 / LW1) TaxID=1189612 RepID=S2DBL0_INDAL|nr:hypothetical protein [Indibacter alkaliphilus]EOZ96547.1 hypothetical protein A33Q_2317 [Indibacter alkaliphilus LW1]